MTTPAWHYAGEHLWARVVPTPRGASVVAAVQASTARDRCTVVLRDGQGRDLGVQCDAFGDPARGKLVADLLLAGLDLDALLRERDARPSPPPPCDDPKCVDGMVEVGTCDECDQVTWKTCPTCNGKAAVAPASPPKPPRDVPLLRHGGRGPRAERARPGALEEDDDE